MAVLLLHIHYIDISWPAKICEAEQFLIVDVLDS